MVSKKQKIKIKKRKSIGGANGQKMLNIAINGQVAAFSNKNQHVFQPTKEFQTQLELAKYRTTSEISRSLATGQPLDTGAITKAPLARIEGLNKMLGRSNKMLQASGIGSVTNSFSKGSCVIL